jgi:aspartokinase/homoserine dehydrogenase 1
MQGKCSVVTCNKIGLSSSQESYDALQETCCATEVKFKYETTVGAALPVISTIKSRVECGDNIRRIEAILSGTLNYLFSQYDGSVKFVDIVREAKKAGYTEPDPRIDLSGTDVARKTVILARESGFRLEPEEIDVVPIFNSDLFSYDSEEFMTKIEECEDQMLSLYKSALSRGERLRYIATIENGNYKISVQSVSSNHPFYNINGRDNAIMIFSDEYTSPLTVSGAGAGARLTASGLFADLLA